MRPSAEQNARVPSGRRRRTYAAEFKAGVVLESMESNLSLTDLARKHGLHPNQIKNWRTQMRQRLRLLFVDRRTTTDPEPS